MPGPQRRGTGPVGAGGERGGERGERRGRDDRRGGREPRVAGEEPVGTHDGGARRPRFGEAVEQPHHRPSGGDLVVEHDRAAPGHVADDRLDLDVVVAVTDLASGRDRQVEEAGEVGGGLGVAEVGGDHHVVAQVAAPEVVGEHADGGEVVDRYREEPVHLRGVQLHREHPVGARGVDEVGHQTASERDAGGVLLVGARVGVVRHDGGDLGGGGPARRVDHHQQLDQVILGRRNQRLDDVDVALPAVDEQLGLQAVVAESPDLRRREGDSQVATDVAGEALMGASGEHDHVTHENPRFSGALARAEGRPCVQGLRLCHLVGGGRARGSRGVGGPAGYPRAADRRGSPVRVRGRWQAGILGPSGVGGRRAGVGASPP